MRTRSIPLAFLLLASLLSGMDTARAQAPAGGALVEGARVRVGLGPEERRATGRVLEVAPGRMTVRLDLGDTVVLAGGSEVEVSRGRRSRAAAGALVGGVAVAAVLLARMDSPSEAEGTGPYPMAGAAAGALVGAHLRYERWTRARVPEPAGAP